MRDDWHRHRLDRNSHEDSAGADDSVPTPGKRALTSSANTRIPPSAPGKRSLTQGLKAGDDSMRAAEEGISGTPGKLPFLDQIQRSFGGHDVTNVKAHTDGRASHSAAKLGGQAYAVGNHVAFGRAPDLHTAAHEAAHVVQQRGGVSMKGRVGEAGDAHEVHADAVADRVVRGESAAPLLDGYGGGSGGAGGAVVQRKTGDPPKPASEGKRSSDGKPSTNDPKERGGRAPKGQAKQPKQGAHHGGDGGTAKKGSAGGPGGGGGGGGATFSTGGVDGGPLKQQLAAFSHAVTEHTSTVQQPPGTDGHPKKESEEDHAKKVSQYEDGVDGIADRIGDLDAFDDLCDACSWGGDKSKKSGALARIRASKPFQQLTKMWQGALDGGVDSERMKKAFDNQFDGRGFWGSTEQAFGLVKADAKRQAREDAAAAEAKKKAKAARAKAGADAAGKAGAGGAGGAAGKAQGPHIDGGAAGAGGIAGLNAAVPATPPPLAAFNQMNAVKDGEFQNVIAQADNHAALFRSAQKQGAESRRTEQILDQLKLAGGGFSEGFFETAKWGIVAHFGDRLAGGAVEKMLGEKVPIVGPVIMLVLDSPFKAKYWSDVGAGFSKGGHSIGHAFQGVFDGSAFKGCHSAGDVVGVLCGKLADLFNGFYEILTTVNKLLATLSALALILGAVLIGVGLALAWLGVGAGLIAAGGWLVEAGEVLGDISLALMPVCLALSAIALVFRTAAAFLVPADVYAEQLAAEGEAADKFGNQAGQRVGLATARAVEQATPHEPKLPTVEEHGGGTRGGAEEGAAEGAKVASDTKAANDAIQEAGKASHGSETKPEAKPETKPEAEGKPETKQPESKEHEHDQEAEEKSAAETEKAKEQQADKVEDKVDEKAGVEEQAGEKTGEKAKEREGQKGEEKTEEKTEQESREKAKEHEEKAKKKSLGRRLAESLVSELIESVKISTSIFRNTGRVIEAVKQLKGLADVRETTNRGLSTRAEMLEKRLEEARPDMERLDAEAKASQAEIDRLLDRLTTEEGTLTKEQTAQLQKQLDEAIDSWSKAKSHGETLKQTLEEAVARAKEGAESKRMPDEEEREGSSAEDEDHEHGSNEEKLRREEDTRHAARKELDKTRQRHGELEAELDSAKRALEAARAEKSKADASSEAAVKAIEDNPANKAKLEASAEVGEHNDALARAKELKSRAGQLRSAEATRKTAQRALEGVVGKTVEVGGAPHKVVGFGPEGVLVEPAAGGAPKSVPAQEIKGEGLPSDFPKQVERVATAEKTIEEASQGDRANPGTLANRLEKTATDIERTERNRYRGPKKQADWAETKRQARELDAERTQAEKPAHEAKDAVEAAEKTVADKQEELFHNESDQIDLEAKAKRADDRAAGLRRAKYDHRRTELYMEKGAELFAHLTHLDKAMSWAWEQSVGRLLETLGLAKHTVEEHEEKEEGKEEEKQGENKTDAEKQASEKEENEKAAAGEAPTTADEKVEGKPDSEEKPEKKEAAAGEKEGEKKATEGKNEGKPEGKEEKEGEGGEEAEHERELEEARRKALAVGAEEAMFEQLLAMRPPGDIALLSDHRKRATDAFAKYRKSHEWAYKCYQAELAVTRLAQESAAMAESGKPLHKSAQAMRAPIEKSKGDEAQRASTLAGGAPGDIKGADSQMSGIVVKLITKLADHSDHLSQKPSAGGANGHDMAGSQDKAASEGHERSQQSKGHSKSQQQFLDQALQLRARQEASVANSIQSLEGKSKEELAIRDQIRQHKAQALANEAAAREECESEAAAFNEGYARASTWAQAYEEKKKKLEGSRGGGE